MANISKSALQKLREEVEKEKQGRNKRTTTPTNNQTTSRTSTRSAPQSSSKSALQNLRDEVAQEKTTRKTTPKTTTPKSTVNFPSAINLGLGPISKQKVASLIGSGDVKVDNNGSLKWVDQYDRDTQKAYDSAKNKVTAKTTVNSELSDDERKARIKEIDNEMRTLHYRIQGLGRANMGGAKAQEYYKTETDKAKARIAELSEEKKKLNRTGTFTASELKQFEIDDAKAQKAQLPSHNATARVSPAGVNAYVENAKAHAEMDNKIKTLEREKELYDDISKYSDDVHKENVDVVGDGVPSFLKNPLNKVLSPMKDFDSQWRANYRSNELSREADKAMAEYLKNPTEENKQIAYAYDALAKTYANNNKEALDDENVKASWLTKSLAGYLPQFKDQIIPEIIGGGLGLAIGSQVGAPNVGASIGAGMGTYSQSYDVIRGSVYRTLLSEGVDEEIARQASEDEALISSLIESGETMISWALSGSGKALSAIGNAAKSSVAKGSTNAATKFIANMATKNAAKQATKAVAKPLWKSALGMAGGILANGASEYGEEFAQQGVSIANKERAMQGETGKANLIKGAGGLIGDAITGKNPEAFSEMHEAGKEGFKIGLMMGGSQTITNNIVSHYANAKTVKTQNEILDTIIKDDESLNALIEEGKASGEKSVSFKIANEVEQAKSKGKVTREQVKKLIASNEVYIEAEEMATAKSNNAKTTKTNTLEKPVVDDVESKNVLSNTSLKEKAELFTSDKVSGTRLRERLEFLSQNNEPITETDVKKATGFDNEGAKVVTKYANQEGATFNRVVTEVKGAYMSGRSHPNVPISNMASELTTPAQADAYSAGQIDRRLQDLSAKAKMQNAVINKDSGFKADNLPKDVTKTQVEILNRIDEALGVKSYVTKDLDANAYLDKTTGEIPIDYDFERTIGKSKQEVSIVYHASHEALHRVVELAPEEGNAFVYAMYNHLAGNEPSNLTLADQKREAYASKGVEISLAKAMEEVSANHVLSLYGNDEGKFQRAIDNIVNGTDTKAKQGLRKFVDGLKKIIRKLNEFIHGKTASERAQIQAEIDEITRMRDMFETAFKKAVENKKALESKPNSSKNLEIKINEEYNGNKDYSLESEQYTEEEYLNYGWVRANDVLNEGEYYNFTSKFADAVEQKFKYPKSKRGEYIIPVSDINEPLFRGTENVLVFAEGKIDNPVINSVIRIIEYDEEILDVVRRFIYDCERRGIHQADGDSFRRYYAESFRFSEARQTSVLSSTKNIKNNGNGTRDIGKASRIKGKSKVDYSLKGQELEDAVNQSMTMEDAKQMIERAFILGQIKEFYDGEYKNGDEWLRGEGASEVALYVENEYTLSEKYLNKIQAYVDGDFYAEDILEAYLKGTLVGREKPKPKRLNLSQEYRINDKRFYSPQQIKDAKKLLSVATQRVTNENRIEVSNARAKILLFSHNKGASELLGLSQAELNKKLRAWSNYSAKARDISTRFNNGVADSNKWTGIENCSWLYKSTIETKDLEKLVKSIKGAASDYEKMYVARTMLALDTHIDWSWLSFEFDTYNNVNKGKTFSVSKCLGYYTNESKKIVVTHDKPNTVAHEMGHALDYQWARDLGFNHSALTEASIRTEAITDSATRQFFDNFKIFIDSLTDNGDIRTEYTQNPKEVFARFVARFVEWVDNTGTGRNSYNTESFYYNDKFTASHYIEFVKLLQEKAMLDSKKGEDKTFSFKDTKTNGVDDVDYSLKGTDLDTKDHKELVDIINHLQNEFEVTKFAKTDTKKLAKMTRDVLKEYVSKADFEEVYKDIDDLYTYMANGEGENPAAWNDVYDRAHTIAQNIVENALVTDDYMYKEYESLRKYLRNTAMKFDTEYDSVPSSYENFNEFRKANMGRLKFTKDGTSIDSVYQELAGIYPEFFNEEEQSNTADQLEQMLNVLDEIQPTEVNPFDRQTEQVSMYLANDLISRFFDLPQAKPTFADKAERRVINERIKGNKKVENVRLQKDEKIKKLLEKQKEKTKKQLDKLRQQRNDKVQKEKQKRRDAVSKMNENQKAKVLRARIMRHTSDLSQKLIRPTDNQHIPAELQGAVAKLLECINLESNYTYDMTSHSYKKTDDGLPTRRTQAFNELKKIYSDMASSVVVDPDLLGENGWLSDVISLADKRIVDMNSSELDTVWQTIRAIEASISTANKIFAEGKFATVLEFAEALRDDNAGKKEKTELKGFLGKGKKLAGLDMLTPETYLHYLGGAGDSIFRMMRNAQDKHISIMKEVADFTHKELKGVDVNKLEKTIHTVKLGDEDVKLSTAQLMELYVLMNREQAVEHILIGGILPDVTKSKGIKLITKTKPIKNITAGEIYSAISKLTDEQKKIADKLQKYVSTTLSAYGNEASMQVYNYEKFLEENYWTIRTNKQEISTEVGKDTTVTSVANKGMAKGTVPHANTSVRIGSIFDTFSAHASDMATYAAWLGTSEDVNRIRNFVFWEDGARTGTVKSILDTVHGLHGSDYLQKLLTDVAIGVKGTDNMNPFDKLIGNYKAASVGANIRVIIQQPTAILRAMDMIGAHYLAEGAVRPLNGWKKAKKHAPIAQWKDWGYFDINTGRQMKDVLFDNASLLEKTKQVGMWGASLADSLAWGQLWNAVEAETKAKHKDLEVKSDKYYETVAKRFTEIVDHTQVVDGILQRSQIMRSPDSLTKMATSFMGEPTKQYNMMISALNDATKGNPGTRKKAVGKLGRTAMTLAVAGILNACAQSIIDALRDDDKEKDYWEKWVVAFMGDGEDTKLINSNIGDTFNPLGYIPFAKDIMSIMQGYDVKRMDAEAITKTVNATTNMYKAITGTGKYTVAEASAQLFAEISRLYGLPVANVKRDIKAITMTTAIQTDNYLMQYRMEKAMLDINYAGNNKNFMDILFNAYNNDREAYEIIYDDMLESGYDVDKIKSGMETRAKKAEGVEKASDLSKRYMTPDVEKKYDSSLERIKSTNTWVRATETQKKDAEADLYEFLTSDSEDMAKTRAEAQSYGVDETEYTLWKLAIEMADQPEGEKGSGSYDYREKAEALNALDFGDKEIAYFFGKGLNESSKEELEQTLDAGIDIQEYVNFKAATSEMEADKNAKGNSIPNSKKRKVVNYLNNSNLTKEEWYYFYSKIMGYKK